MKKSIVVTAAVSTLFLLTACQGAEAPETVLQIPEVAGAELTASVSTPDATNVSTLRSGLGVITTLTSSKEATDEKDGQGQVDSIIVGLTVDENDIIQDIRIDAAQTRVGFSNEGQILSDLNAPVFSKIELGTDYGMGQVSEVGEYYEQMAGLREWAIGRSVSEFMGMPLDGGHATDADLMATTTISVDGYINTFSKAIENLNTHQLEGGEKIGLGIETKISGSKNASEETNGSLEVASYIAMLTLNEEGIITSVTLDRAQSRIGIDGTGAYTTDISEPVLTSVELGDDYNMRRVSGIEKELFEQYEGLEAWMIGKTPEEVITMTLDEGGHPTDVDVRTSATIALDDILVAVQKAAENIK